MVQGRAGVRPQLWARIAAQIPIVDAVVFVAKWPLHRRGRIMRVRRGALLLTALILFVFVGVNFAAENTSEATGQGFLGRWDLTLATPGREYPSWLEVTQEGGQFKARMVSRWGHARPLPKVEISGDHITFVSPKEEEDRKVDRNYDGPGRNRVAMDRRESARPEEKERASVGKAGAVVRRQGFEGMDAKRSERDRKVDG